MAMPRARWWYSEQFQRQVAAEARHASLCLANRTARARDPLHTRSVTTQGSVYRCCSPSLPARCHSITLSWLRPTHSGRHHHHHCRRRSHQRQCHVPDLVTAFTGCDGPKLPPSSIAEGNQRDTICASFHHFNMQGSTTVSLAPGLAHLASRPLVAQSLIAAPPTQ
jgi:hypothetical protein